MPPKRTSPRNRPSTNVAEGDQVHEQASAKGQSTVRSEAQDSGLELVSDSRATPTHIFFWGSILSNWWLASPPFSGATCLEHMLPQLDHLKISHPPPDCLSTRILAAHEFVSGEQWMMAVKAWLFERETSLAEQPVRLDQEASSEGVIGKEQFDNLRALVMETNPPANVSQDAAENTLYRGTMYAVLRTSAPREQKALGRQVSGFVQKPWEEASVAIVTASCIARAEVDAALRRLYMAAGSRKFVEGSPIDKIWGVGLKWNNPKIDDEANWKGENRLGQCHDAAAKYIREKFSV